MTAGAVRDARAVRVSLMLIEAKPMPAESAKASVNIQTSHPASAAPRRLLRHAMAAIEGMTRAEDDAPGRCPRSPL